MNESAQIAISISPALTSFALHFAALVPFHF